MPLERAIRKLAGEPADMFGFEGRGYLREGYAADVCVFDPTTVAPGPQRRVRDLPADGERLTNEEPSGVRHVLVNGSLIRADERQLELETAPRGAPDARLKEDRLFSEQAEEPAQIVDEQLGLLHGGKWPPRIP
jgi:dihydroorotase-like cyclic amidohydrolase